MIFYCLLVTFSTAESFRKHRHDFFRDSRVFAIHHTVITAIFGPMCVDNGLTSVQIETPIYFFGISNHVDQVLDSWAINIESIFEKLSVAEQKQINELLKRARFDQFAKFWKFGAVFTIQDWTSLKKPRVSKEATTYYPHRSLLRQESRVVSHNTLSHLQG